MESMHTHFKYKTLFMLPVKIILGKRILKAEEKNQHIFFLKFWRFFRICITYKLHLTYYYSWIEQIIFKVKFFCSWISSLKTGALNIGVRSYYWLSVRKDMCLRLLLPRQMRISDLPEKYGLKSTLNRQAYWPTKSMKLYSYENLS